MIRAGFFYLPRVPKRTFDTYAYIFRAKNN